MNERESLIYGVPGVSCEHCRAAITDQVSQVEGVKSVYVDLDAKSVKVDGEGMAAAAVREAIDAAGYEISESVPGTAGQS